MWRCDRRREIDALYLQLIDPKAAWSAASRASSFRFPAFRVTILTGELERRSLCL
jgi:hypothetical protein